MATTMPTSWQKKSLGARRVWVHFLKTYHVISNSHFGVVPTCFLPQWLAIPTQKVLPCGILQPGSMRGRLVKPGQCGCLLSQLGAQLTQDPWIRNSLGWPMHHGDEIGWGVCAGPWVSELLYHILSTLPLVQFGRIPRTYMGKTSAWHSIPK